MQEELPVVREVLIQIDHKKREKPFAIDVKGGEKLHKRKTS
jgi:hypothetical protein